MRRDLRKVSWFMAVLMPVMVVLTLLTSEGSRHVPRLTTSVAHRVAGARVALERYDEAGETRRLERRELA